MTATPLYRAGAGEPLVLLHGFTDTWRTWALVLPALEQEYDVFALTLPGHDGAAPFVRDAPLTWAAIVDAVEAQLDNAGIQTAHIAGNSLGGWLALELAARGRARSVVAFCPAGGWVRGSREERRLLRYFRRGLLGLRLIAPHIDRLSKLSAFRHFAMRNVASSPRSIPTERVAEVLHGAARCDIAADALRHARREGFGELGPIDCPVRIYWGSRDRLIRWPSCFQRFHDLVPTAEIHELRGAAHAPMWEFPELVVQSIRDVAKPALSSPTQERVSRPPRGG